MWVFLGFIIKKEYSDMNNFFRDDTHHCKYMKHNASPFFLFEILVSNIRTELGKCMSQKLTISSYFTLVLIRKIINKLFYSMCNRMFCPNCINTCPPGLYGDECGGLCFPNFSNSTCHHVHGRLESNTETFLAKA